MSNKIKLSSDQERLVEKLGIVNESSGIQPAAARVLSLLLIADEAELTFDQIYETLGISKSAASNAINLLLTTNKIDYVTKFGDRKRYFRSKIMFWQDDLKNNLNNLGAQADILNDVLKSRPGNTIEFNNQLKNVIDFIQFLHSELPNIYTKWEKIKK